MTFNERILILECIKNLDLLETENIECMSEVELNLLKIIQCILIYMVEVNDGKNKVNP